MTIQRNTILLKNGLYQLAYFVTRVSSYASLVGSDFKNIFEEILDSEAEAQR